MTEVKLDRVEELITVFNALIAVKLKYPHKNEFATSLPIAAVIERICDALESSERVKKAGNFLELHRRWKRLTPARDEWRVLLDSVDVGYWKRSRDDAKQEYLTALLIPFEMSSEHHAQFVRDIDSRSDMSD